MKFLKQHVPELVIAMFSVVSSLVILMIRGRADLLGYVVAATGCQLTITVFLLKSVIKAGFDELRATLNLKLELYESLPKISYPGLHHRATETIEHAREILKELSEGKIRDHADNIFLLLSDEIVRAKSEVLAVHVVEALADIAAWKEPPMSFYYEQNVNAVKRGVKVRRIFILFKHAALDSRTGYLMPEVKEILRQQKDDGIDVRVVLEDVVRDKGYIKDWAVIDQKVVEYSSGAGDFGSNKWTHRIAYFSVDRREVERYVDKFGSLERYTKDLEKWLDEYDPVEDGVKLKVMR